MGMIIILFLAFSLGGKCMGNDIDFDRPSMHGKILGDFLADLATRGQAIDPEIPDPCATCAFIKGTAPNMTAGTGSMALDCTLGTDTDRFACHHGMQDGQPTKVCNGYLAAQRALRDESTWQKIHPIKSDDPDEIRAAFDVWYLEYQANGGSGDDIYKIARDYQKYINRSQK